MQVIDCIRRADDVMAGFGQPVYYVDPRPHVSVAWCLGDVRDMRERTHAGALSESVLILADKVHVTVGNRKYEIPLLE